MKPALPVTKIVFPFKSIFCIIYHLINNKQHHRAPFRAQALRAIQEVLDVGRSLPGVNYIPLPKIGEGLGEWSEAPSYEEGVGVDGRPAGEPCIKAAPSQGALNLRAEERKKSSRLALQTSSETFYRFVISIETPDVKSPGSHRPGMHGGMLHHIMCQIPWRILPTPILH